MEEIIHYNKVASILLKEENPISIKKLSLVSGLTLDELKLVLKYFCSEGFLKHEDNYDKIILSEKAKRVE